MVYVVVFAVLVFLGGIAVVAFMGVRLLRQVKVVKRAADDATAAIADATARIEELRPSQPR